MAKRSRSKKVRHLLSQNIHPHAAGIDVSATEMVVAVPPDQGPEPVRTYGTTTDALRDLCAHLLAEKITTVAMESTGLYWMPLYDVLEAAGMEVCLVNARHVKNVPGRKTDVVDAPWLQQLHAAGLLRGGFRPAPPIRILRDHFRERADLLQQSSHQILMMQRCFDQMNLQLHRVISDLDGISGLRMIEAILAGERNAAALERLRDPRCKTPKAKVIQALTGQWDEDCVARLGRAYAVWKAIREQMENIQARVEVLIGQMETPVHPVLESAKQKGAKEEEPQASTGGRTYVLKPAENQTKGNSKSKTKGKGKTREQEGKNGWGMDLRSESERLFGTDLMAIPGVGQNVIITLLSEVGTADAFAENFPTCKQFTSWLGLCPDNRISGGRVLGSKTRPVAHRIAAALRFGAYALWQNTSGLGQYCRKMKGRLGKAEGITATAHKMARAIYAMITRRQAYDEQLLCHTTPAALARKLKNLENRAKTLGYELVATA